MAVATPSFVVERVDHWLVISFTQDRLTEPDEIHEACEGVLEEIKDLPLRCSVVLDFRRVNRVSSQFIGLMLGVKRAIDQKHGTLVLTRVGEELRDVLELTRLIGQFTIAERLRDVVTRSKRRVDPYARGGAKRGGEETLWIDSVV